MSEDLLTTKLELPGGPLRISQPAESAELPDAGGVEWAPLAPYWSVLWRSGVVLASEVENLEPAGLRVVELGCGLAAPSIAAARAGADVLATDADREAVELVGVNARANGVELEAAVADWTAPDRLLASLPFDLVLGADLLYEDESVVPLLALLPRLAPQALLAGPDRGPARSFLERAPVGWSIDSHPRGVITVHRLGFGHRGSGAAAESSGAADGPATGARRRPGSRAASGRAGREPRPADSGRSRG